MLGGETRWGGCPGLYGVLACPAGAVQPWDVRLRPTCHSRTFAGRTARRGLIPRSGDFSCSCRICRCPIRRLGRSRYWGQHRRCWGYPIPMARYPTAIAPEATREATRDRCIRPVVTSAARRHNRAGRTAVVVGRIAFMRRPMARAVAVTPVPTADEGSLPNRMVASAFALSRATSSRATKRPHHRSAGQQQTSGAVPTAHPTTKTSLRG